MDIYYTQKKRIPTFEISRKAKTVQTNRVMLDLSEREFLDFVNELTEFAEEYSSESEKRKNAIFRFDTETDSENSKAIIFAIGD